MPLLAAALCCVGLELEMGRKKSWLNRRPLQVDALKLFFSSSLLSACQARKGDYVIDLGLANRDCEPGGAGR